MAQPREPNRSTLRDVAVAAGVSQMTVSRALTGRGRIAETTRKRIAALAAKLGYRPDPEVAKLMHHLRGGPRRRFQSVIVGLTTRPVEEREAYFCAMVAGAEAFAQSRGYGFEVVHISPQRTDWNGVERTLLNRGVEGILLLTQNAPVDLTGLLAWKYFSVVSASASALGPAVHRVMPHHFANTLLLCRALAARGHARIGLVTSTEHDLRSEHGFTAAVSWHGLNEAKNLVPPLLTTSDMAQDLPAWFARERPDAIITNELRSARECERILGSRRKSSVRLAVTSLPVEYPKDIVGIDERPAAIGRASADLLANMVERRVRGLPDAPTTLLLTGLQVG